MTGPLELDHDMEGDVRDVAAGWFARQRSGEMSPDDRLALRAWLQADPRHRIVYASVRRAWGGAALLRGDPNVLAIREHWSRHRRRTTAVRALAACLAVIVLAGAGLFGWWEYQRPKPLTDQAFHTAVGERTTVRLPDGSELILNTDTVVRTRADEDRRLVILERGEAYFRVAKDARRPFVVTAGGRTVTALGTAFDIRLDKGSVKVTLVEGKVRVEAPLPRPKGAGPEKAISVQATEMSAGSQLVAAAEQPWRVTAANVVVETSWTKDILIFDDEPLEAVLAELNRYSEKKIILADPAIRDMPISGTFRTGDVDSFVRTIEAYRLARAGADTSDAVQLRRFSE